MADWKLKFVYSPEEKKLYRINHKDGKLLKEPVHPIGSPDKGNLLAVHTLSTPDGTYAVQEFEKGVSLSLKKKEGKMEPIGDFPSREAAQKAAGAHGGLTSPSEPGVGDAEHFRHHPMSSDPLAKDPEPTSVIEPEVDEPVDPEGGETDAEAQARADAAKRRRELGPVDKTAADVPGGTGHRVGGGLPVAGSTHEPGADIAPAAAGYRSAIEKIKETILGFFDKYEPFFGQVKGTMNLDPQLFRKQIEDLDKGRSDQLMTRVNTLSGNLHDLYKAARAEIAEKVKKKAWSQKYPKYTEEQLVTALKRARKSEKYEKDADVRTQVDSTEENYRQFIESLRELIKADPQFQELEKDYTIASGAIRVAQSSGGRLAASTMGSQKADKVVGKRHQRMRPLTAPDSDEIIGWVPLGEPETLPQEPTTSRTPSYQRMSGMSPEKERAGIERQIYDIMKKYDNDLGLVRTNKADFEKLEHLKAQRAAILSPKNFTVRKKDDGQEG